MLNKVISTCEPACLAEYIGAATEFMPSGHAVEFDLICLKVREDDGGPRHLLHLRHGVNSLPGWREADWAVSALMGLQKPSHWSLTCFMDSAEQQRHSLPGGCCLSESQRPGLWKGPLLWSHCGGHCRGLGPQDCELLEVGTLLISVSLSQMSGKKDSAFHLPYPVSSASSSPRPLCPLLCRPLYAVPHAVPLVHAISLCLHLSEFSAPFQFWF